MKIYKVILLVFGVLLISGCGDQMWCGENGCQDTTKSGNVTAGKHVFLSAGNLHFR